MNTPEQALAVIKDEATRLDALMRDDLRRIVNPVLAEIINHAIFQGGKRIRPILTCLAASLVGPAPADTPRLAIAFEYLHAASLLHDDVIDHAELRRGRPTANRLWGMEQVILAGDYLHAHAMALAGETGGREAMRIIGRATAAMVEAEFLQIETARERVPSEENYLRVLEGKTAALIAAACEAGIAHNHGGQQQRTAMVAYGKAIGLAFQMIDDLLDYLGDPSQTGKAAGNDFTEGKMTLPLLHALQNAPAADRQTLADLLQMEPSKRAGKFAEAREIIERNQGFSATKSRAETLIENAIDGLALFGAAPAREPLAGLARFVLSRDR